MYVLLLEWCMARTRYRGLWPWLSWILRLQTLSYSGNCTARSLVLRDWGIYGWMCLDQSDGLSWFWGCVYLFCIHTYIYIYMWYEPRPHAHPMQANLPLCIRYLVGCKYTSLPGRWETWLSIEWKYFGRSEFEWRVGRAWCYICIPRTWSFNIFVLERISLNLGGAGHQGRFDKNCKGKQKVKGQRKLKAWTWRWLQLTLQDPHIFVFEDFAIRALYMWEAGYQGLRSMDT